MVKKMKGPTTDKTKRRPRKRKNPGHRAAKNADADSDDELLAAAAAWASTTAAPPPLPIQSQAKKAKKSSVSKDLPPQFPPNLEVPKFNGFLQNQGRWRKTFQIALDTAYEGFAFDTDTSIFNQQEIQRALNDLDKRGYFGTDVTQPSGLGGKCVPTYVTRCLLGDPGTTYKYLGLRMFSYPWRRPTDDLPWNDVSAFHILNQTLSKQTKKHMEHLRQKRSDRQGPPPRGRLDFNVTLINKMKTTARLKQEPVSGRKCTVSWHADSSLEHYSTIAVYHTIVNNGTHPEVENNREENQWSVALRVAHNAEGPHAKRLSDIKTLDSVPPIAINLPSGAAYYMLDDHNHHHQHTVLAPENDSVGTIRFSSTHRRLRTGHTVQEILSKCKDICSNLHRNGPKRWRAEQDLLNQIENEWLRQFFIQGRDHKESLWDVYWKHPIQELFQYWSKLEERTGEILLVLRHACEERSQNDFANYREERRKALALVWSLTGKQPAVAKKQLYDTFAEILIERSRKRGLWLQRETDAVFKRMPAGRRPIPFPVRFQGESVVNPHDAFATSPLPSDVGRDGKDLAKLGNVFLRSNHLERRSS